MDWLLASDEPVIRYRTRTWVLGQAETNPAARRARPRAGRQAPRVAMAGWRMELRPLRVGPAVVLPRELGDRHRPGRLPQGHRRRRCAGCRQTHRRAPARASALPHAEGWRADPSQLHRPALAGVLALRLPRRPARPARRRSEATAGLPRRRRARPPRVEAAAGWPIPSRPNVVATPEQPDLPGRRGRLGQGPAERRPHRACSIGTQSRGPLGKSMPPEVYELI